MSDETTWDTDEAQLWIANDYALYDFCRVLAGRARNHHQLALQLHSEIDWRSYNSDITPNDVDWEYIARELLEEHG